MFSGDSNSDIHRVPKGALANLLSNISFPICCSHSSVDVPRASYNCIALLLPNRTSAERTDLSWLCSAHRSRRSLCFRIGIGRLILEGFDELEEKRCKNRTTERSHPIHPLCRIEACDSDCRGERSSWVQRTSGPENTCK